MLRDLLAMDLRGRNANVFQMPQANAMLGFGDEVAVGGNIPASERTGPPPGMFGNSRASALAASQGSGDTGAGVRQPAPISLMPLDQMLAQNSAAPSIQPLAGVKPKKPAFFGKDGVGWDIVGAIGDALATAGGGQAMYLPLKMQQHQRALALADEARKQNAAWEMWKRQQDYTWANKPRDPRQPHYWESNDGSLMALGDDGKPVKVYADPTPKMNFIPDGMGGGQWVAVPTSAPMTPPATGNRPKIGEVLPDPRRGGGSGNATGGFR